MDGDPLVQSGVSSFSERSSRSDVSKRRFGPCVSPGVLAVIMLLLVQMLERVAYYTITNNIEPYIHTYLHTFELGKESALLSTVIVGTTWILSPLLAGSVILDSVTTLFLSDAWQHIYLEQD